MSAPESNRRAGSVAAWAIAGALCLVTSCAATLSVRGTTPATLAEGTCERHTDYPAVSPMHIIARVEGVGLIDSLWLEPGAPFRFEWQVPPGTYIVTAWARNQGGVSCISSVVIDAVSRPGLPRLEP